MDDGVFPLHVPSHPTGARRPPAPGTGEPIVPTLTPTSPVVRSGAVSLIVPTFFNGRLKNRALRRVLSGVERSGAVAEVVLVAASGADSGDGDVAQAAGGKPLVVVECEPNRRSASRNVGASKASNDLLLFLDDDMLLKDWALVDVLVSELLSGGFDCALFPRRHYAKFPLLYDDDALGRLIACWRAQEDGLDDPRLLDPVRQAAPYRTMAFCFPGCFMLIRREAYDRVGGFPAEYEGWGFEDAAFALRSVTSLRVLNLFRKSSPLLHIDHPVSPYKAEEYAANLSRFRSAHGPTDMGWLCRRVSTGDDFTASGAGVLEDPASFGPIESLAAAYHVPCARGELADYYGAILRKRVESGYDPVPEHVVLHGSRGGGTSTTGSDFDLLFLYREGMGADFFVGQGEGAPRVEAEFSDFAKFERIALRPAQYPLSGPLELAKVARGILLWGDAEAWQSWAEEVLGTAMRHGRAYWLAYALGLGLEPEKVGVMRSRFADALGAVMVRVDPVAYREDIDRLAESRLDTLGGHLGALLDREFPGWRGEVRRGRKVFADQVPEVWRALRWILDGA